MGPVEPVGPTCPVRTKAALVMRRFGDSVSPLTVTSSIRTGPKASLGAPSNIPGVKGVTEPSCTLKKPLVTVTVGWASPQGLAAGSGSPTPSTTRKDIAKVPLSGSPAASVKRP